MVPRVSHGLKARLPRVYNAGLRIAHGWPMGLPLVYILAPRLALKLIVPAHRLPMVAQWLQSRPMGQLWVYHGLVMGIRATWVVTGLSSFVGANRDLH